MPKRLTLENHLTEKQLRRKYLTCQHPQEKMRWQALCLIAEGGVANQVAETLGRCSGWMSETVRRYNEGGVGAVKNKSKNQGSKTLTAEQLKELESEIESGKTTEQRLWSGAQIKRWVAEKTGTTIHKTTYGWQFRDEKVFMPSEQGEGISLFGFLSRTNRLIFEMTSERITGEFVLRQIEKLVDVITKPTVIVLDNAPSNRNRKMQERIPYWEAKRLVYILFAGLFAAFEYRRNSLAQTKIRMAVSGRLSELGEFEVSSQIRTIKCRKFTENQFFKLQS